MQKNTTPRPCRTKKTDGDGDIRIGEGAIVPGNLKKPENKRKVRSALLLIAISVVGIIFFFTTSSTVLGEPVDPASFGLSMSFGILIGAGLAILFIVVYVSKRASEKKHRA